MIEVFFGMYILIKTKKEANPYFVAHFIVNSVNP